MNMILAGFPIGRIAGLLPGKDEQILDEFAVHMVTLE